MMPGSAVARLLFTCVFAAAALGAALRPRDRAGAGFCIAMCAALIAMTWWTEPASAVWLQVAAFSGAALWLLLSGPVLTGVQHALMAAAMTWMLTAMPAHGAMPARMAAMAGSTRSVLVLAVSGLVAACCVVASIPLVTQAIGGPGLRLTDLRAASQAAMSVGMAAMVIAML